MSAGTLPVRSTVSSMIPRVVQDALNVPEDGKVLVSVSLIVNNQSSPVARRDGNEVVQCDVNRNRVVHPCPHVVMDLFVLRSTATTPNQSLSASSSSSSSSSCTSSSSSSSGRSTSIPTNHFRIFVINVQRVSAAFHASLQEGDEIVEWLGEKIASELQFLCVLAFGPSLCLTVKRTVTTSFEKQQRLRIDYLEKLLQENIQLMPECIIPNSTVPFVTDGSSTAIDIPHPHNGSNSTAVENESSHKDQVSKKSKKPRVQKGSTSFSASALNTPLTETLIVPTAAAKNKKKRNISEIEASGSSFLNSSTNNNGQSKREDAKRNNVETSQPLAAVSNEIFSASFDEKNLPRTWRKTSNGRSVYFEHIVSGLKVYNSRVMSRVMQLFFSTNTTNTTRPFMSVQAALKQANCEYKEYKQRLAAASASSMSNTYNTNNNQQQAPSLPEELDINNAISSSSSSLAQPCINQEKKPHFQFDLQEQPRGWLRFDQDKRGKYMIYWKHSNTGHKVKDPVVMARVLPLLDEQIRGSNMTVKEAIKQAKMENEKGVYTVDLFDSKNSSSVSSAHISNTIMPSQAASSDVSGTTASTLLRMSGIKKDKRRPDRQAVDFPVF